MSKKLTRKQVIRALRRLEKGWPDDLWIFVGDGSVHLMDKTGLGRGEHAETKYGGVDPAYEIKQFKIESDGGGW